MNELIKVENKDGKETVNARELYIFLESKQDFSTWIKNRIEKYGFIENLDYITAPQNYGTANGGYSIRNEYYLSIDMAKELSMIENNEKGREARKYFIDIENKWNNPDSILARALQIANNRLNNLTIQNEQQQKQIIEQKPMVDFYKDVTGSTDTIGIGEVAKILNVKNVGRNRLFDILREKEIFMIDNKPYQKYVDRGYFRLIEQKYTKPDGSTHISFKTVVYQKGLEFIKKIISEVK